MISRKIILMSLFLAFNSAKNTRNKEHFVFYINIQIVHRDEIFNQFDIFVEKIIIKQRTRFI